MARYPLVNPGTIVLTSPSAGGLLTAIEAVQGAEAQFYRDRRNLVNSYPLKTRDISTEEIEALYDTHLGNEPWRYKDRFNASGSTIKSGAPIYTGNGLYFTEVVTARHWVDAWGPTPMGSGYPEARNNAFLFEERRGAAWVDLIVKFGYSNGFRTRGGTRAGSIVTGGGDGQSTTFFVIYEGFGLEPLAYDGRGGLSDFEAHMLALVGDAYEATVRPAINNYRNLLNSYQSSNGSPTGITFVPNNPASPWEGFTGTAGGYNRPGQLNAALVRETRGVG